MAVEEVNHERTMPARCMYGTDCAARYISRRNQAVAMSGGGGGRQPSDRYIGNQNGDSSSDPCDIREETTLNSPNRAIVSTLRVGDALNVEYVMGPPRQLLAKLQDEIAGSITSPKNVDIIRCILDEDRQYEAIVRSITGGHCNVRIRPQ